MSNPEIDGLANMFPDLTKSTILDVFHTNNKDYEKTLDELLTLNMSRSTLLTSVIDRSTLSEQEEFFLAERERMNKQAEKEKQAREQLERENRERENREREIRLREQERQQKEQAEQDKLRKLREDAERMQREQQELAIRKGELQRLKQEQIEAEKRKQAEAEAARLEKARIEAQYQKEVEARLLAEREAQEKLRLLELEKQRLEQISREKNELEKNQQKLKEEEELKAKALLEVQKRTEEAELLLKKAQQDLIEQNLKKELLLKQERAEREAIEAQIKAEAEKNQQLQEKIAQYEKDRQAEAEKLRKQEEEKEAAAREEAEKKKRTIIIYTRGAQDVNKNQEALTNEIKVLLGDKGFTEEEYTIMDTSGNQELAAYLKESCGNKEITFPIVDILRIPVGNIDQLKKILADSNNVQRIKNGEFAYEGSGKFVGQGVLDHCLDAAEYVISGVKSVLWSPVSFVGWLTGYGGSSLTKGPEDHDFEIVHTNWYWRNLKRKFRFTSDSILRIHPVHNDVRATHTYASIRQLQVVDDTNFVIDYSDSSPDYIQADSVDIVKMMNIIKERSKREVFVVDNRAQ